MHDAKREKLELLNGNDDPYVPTDLALEEQQVFRRLGIPIIVFMIIGKVVGGALIWFPKAINDIGLLGFAVLLICVATSTFTGVLLSKSWIILMRWYPEKYRDQVNRFPYPSIGYESFGTIGRRVTASLIGMYGFGFNVALYIVVADNIKLTFQLLGVNVPICMWIPIVCAVGCPLLWFGTPKNMVGAGIASGATCIIVVVSLIIGSLLDIGKYPDVYPIVERKLTMASVLGDLGLILSAVGGQFVIPTLQHDMKHPEDMPKAAVIAYTCIGLIYAAVGGASYGVYGVGHKHSDAENIVELMSSEVFQLSALIFASLHIVLAVVFLTNPTFQDVENHFNIPYELNWRRIVFRSSFSAVVLFVALSIPNFSTYLSLFGGILVCVVNGILPSILYWKLRSIQPPPGVKSEGPLRWYHIAALCTVICISVTLAILTTISGVLDFMDMNANSTLPCYIHHR